MVQSKLRIARMQKGYTQEYIANNLGISQKQYSRLENGESGMTLDYLEKICEKLEISPQDLFACEAKEDSSACLIVNEFSEKLIEQYEKRLKDKDEEVCFLRSLLSGKNVETALFS